MKVKTPPIVVIEWEDSWAAHGWTSEELLKELIQEGCPIWSAGYLVDSSGGFYTIVPTWRPNGHTSNAFSIPKKCVKSLKTVRK